MAGPLDTSSPIQHVVVLMMENRSYDNILGMLYAPGQMPVEFTGPSGITGLTGQAALNGLAGASFSNLPEPGADPVYVRPAPVTTCPTADPGEWFEYMAQQYLGLTGPLPLDPKTPTTSSDPYAGAPGALGPMGGFIANYAIVPGFIASGATVSDVMTYFTPAQLPVTAFLARNFMVCDQWFASAPTHTFVNRIMALAAAPGTFEHAGATYSYINDTELAGVANDTFGLPAYGAYPDELGNPLTIPTVLRQLDAVRPPGPSGPPNWKVYFHDYSIAQNLFTDIADHLTDSIAGKTGTVRNIGPYDASYYGLTGPTGPTGPWPPWAWHELGSETMSVNVTVTSFKNDLANGTLPSFCIIEPQYSCNYDPWHPILGATAASAPNSNHPGQSSFATVDFGGRVGPPTDCYDGETLIADVVTSLYGSPYWDSTVLIITYDEAGGMYDHVFPPPAPAPASDTAPTFTGNFRFERLGGRIPTIIVSKYAYPASAMQVAPWAQNGATAMPPGATAFDHTSVIKTVWELFGLAAGPSGATSLTDRDAAAPSILPYLGPTGVNFTVIPSSTNPGEWSG